MHDILRYMKMVRLFWFAFVFSIITSLLLYGGLYFSSDGGVSIETIQKSVRKKIVNYLWGGSGLPDEAEVAEFRGTGEYIDTTSVTELRKKLESQGEAAPKENIEYLKSLEALKAASSKINLKEGDKKEIDSSDSSPTLTNNPAKPITIEMDHSQKKTR